MGDVNVDRNLITECLKELSDTEYQINIWVKGSPDEVSDFNDVIAALFDDSQLDESLSKNKMTFTLEIDNKLRKLSNLVTLLPDSPNNKSVLSSPKWKEVVEISREIYILLGSWSEGRPIK